jgi:hypothetical protein
VRASVPPDEALQTTAASPLISTRLSSLSASVLLLGGLALLFASDAILPRLIPSFPAAGAWLGQVLAAAWLAIAALNWLSRSVLLGGIYGRPVVLTNAALYFISAMVLIKIVTSRDAPATLWLVVVLTVLLAGAYGWLLFRGPLERDFTIHRGRDGEN